MANKEEEIDGDLLTSIAKNETVYEKGTPEFYVVKMLEDAARDLGVANLEYQNAQKALVAAQEKARKAEAERKAAAKLLTTIHRAKKAAEPVLETHKPA